MTKSDCDALVDLYYATNGDNWTNKTNWLTSTDVGTWYGVTRVGGRVTQINLSSNNLLGVLPSSINNLVGL